ncbi:glycoside hydrolase family 36 protein [Streptomyces sp. NPDC018000]|uniref:glycoside hydrolase family 36 protein n=1 Tax=Streptomyces sp. NPDC018000 TaxID=3365028 RepID=UPI0037B84EBE
MDTGSTRPAELSPFDPDQWQNCRHTVHINGMTVSVHSPDGTAALAREPGGRAGAEALVTVSETTVVTVRLDVPLGDAAGFWHPDAGWERTLPADWSAWRILSLARSAPVGCLYDATGRSLLAFATDHTVQETLIRFGVSEERKRFGVWLRFTLTAGQTCRLRLGTSGATVAAVLRELRGWLAELPGAEPLPVPEFGRTPVYSTWYAFTQDVNASEVEEEAALAAELGCGQLFMDDGWQLHGDGRGYAGCGDWQPDPAKFPDFPAHVQKIHDLGLRYTAWIAPLLLGERAAAHRTWARFAPRRVPHLNCHILDPRHREVRDHVVATCRTLVEENHLDGLKVDFLDEAMAYAVAPAPDRPAHGYISDVGQAMAALLADLRDTLRALRGDEFVVELRQPYTGPAMTAFGNLLRATDCPADPVANRIRTLDIALIAPGGAVHSDMLMWDPQATPETLARQFHGALHAVPQISTRLSQLSPAHRDTLAFWLATWRRLRPALTGGHYETGRPDEMYPYVTASSGSHRVITTYTDRVIALPPEPWHTLSLINATTSARILLEASGPTRLVRMNAYDAQGQPQEATTLELTPGLHVIKVPPSGLCDLHAAGNTRAGSHQI